LKEEFWSFIHTPPIYTCGDLNKAPDHSAEKHQVNVLCYKSSTPHTVARELSSPSAEVRFMNLLELTQVPRRSKVIHQTTKPQGWELFWVKGHMFPLGTELKR
jgi:hypothetical protein